MKLTVEHYKVVLTIEDNNEIDIHELFQHFKTLTIGMGYSPKIFDEAIIEYFEQNNLNSEL